MNTKDEHVQSWAPRPCPTCGKDGWIYRVEMRTLLGYSGPLAHDPNCHTGRFRCSDGHDFQATTQAVCSCGWSRVFDCRISGHNKITPITEIKE